MNKEKLTTSKYGGSFYKTLVRVLNNIKDISNRKNYKNSSIEYRTVFL